MEDSILKSTKKLCGVDPTYTAFDLDITLHINSVFSTLTQLGVGPTDGFSIEDDTSTWSEFTDNDPVLSSVKSYMFLRVRMLFDPPATSFLQEAFDKQIKELEWRLNVAADNTPLPVPVVYVSDDSYCDVEA